MGQMRRPGWVKREKENKEEFSGIQMETVGMLQSFFP